MAAKTRSRKQAFTKDAEPIEPVESAATAVEDAPTDAEPTAEPEPIEDAQQDAVEVASAVVEAVPVAQPVVSEPPAPEPPIIPDELYEMNQDAEKLRYEHVVLARQTRAKKGELDDALGRIQTFIRESRMSFPLFPDPKPEPFEAAGLPLSDPIDEPEDASETAPAEHLDATVLMDVPASALIHHGMPKKYVSVLADAGVTTIGDLGRLGDEGRSLTDLPGISQATADKIETALHSLKDEWFDHNSIDDSIDDPDYDQGDPAEEIEPDYPTED